MDRYSIETTDFTGVPTPGRVKGNPLCDMRLHVRQLGGTGYLQEPGSKVKPQLSSCI